MDIKGITERGHIIGQRERGHVVFAAKLDDGDTLGQRQTETQLQNAKECQRHTDTPKGAVHLYRAYLFGLR